MRQLKCIIEVMKPLSLILLVAVCAEAQTLADIARKERERQARVQSVRVFTTEDARSAATPALPPSPATAPTPNAGTTAAPTAAPVPPAAAAPVPTAGPDPVERWNQEMDKIRAKLRELQDQETALQLQLNDFTNQFTAPKANENNRRQVQIRIVETQGKLNAVRSELEQTRKTMLAMEAQGPTKKP